MKRSFAIFGLLLAGLLQTSQAARDRTVPGAPVTRDIAQIQEQDKVASDGNQETEIDPVEQFEFARGVSRAGVADRLKKTIQSIKDATASVSLAAEIHVVKPTLQVAAATTGVIVGAAQGTADVLIGQEEDKAMDKPTPITPFRPLQPMPKSKPKQKPKKKTTGTRKKTSSNRKKSAANSATISSLVVGMLLLGMSLV